MSLTSRPGGAAPGSPAPAPQPPVIPPAPVLARPRDRRRRGVIIWGLLIVVLGGLGAWWGFDQASSQVTVVAMATDVEYGQTLTLQDLVAVEVTVDPTLSTVPWSSVATLVGQHASTRLLRGTLVSPRSVTSGSVTTADQSVVGVSVSSAQSPTMMLLPQDRVRLVVIPASTDAATLDLSSSLAGVDATVLSVGGTQSGGGRTVDVVVSNDVSQNVAALAAAGRIAIVFVSRG